MLEGTRNERAAIVSASYVIGFVTAFIAFGVNQLMFAEPAVIPPVVSAQPATAIEAFAPSVDLAERDDGLYLTTANGVDILLTVHRTSETVAADTSDGLYTSLSHYELSPKADYAYFCEVPLNGLKDCIPFVYSLGHDTITPLKSDGARIALSQTEQDVTWGPNGISAISNIPIDAQQF